MKNFLIRSFLPSLRMGFICRFSTLCKPFVLGIETSCDDTGAAVVDGCGNVLGEGLHSQTKIHVENGGVIPHIAVHLHRENIKGVVSSALETSGLKLQDLSAIAVTTKPGLRGSLLVGIQYAKHLAVNAGKPLIPVHHMEAHALTVRLFDRVEFPFLALLASGGHCLLTLVKEVDEFYLLGTSKHNSPGEVLDKIARRLKLHNLPDCYAMSGGQAIENMAQNGNPNAYNFPHAMTQYRDCNFSFSGFVSFSTTTIEEEEEKYDVSADGVIPTVKDFCASLLHGYTLHMMHRIQRAFLFCEKEKLLPCDKRILVFSGGVACNTFIRKELKNMCISMNSEFYAPPPKYCTDNGVMIAWNGMERFKKNCDILSQPNEVRPEPECSLGVDISTSVSKASLKVRVPKLISEQEAKSEKRQTNIS